MLKRILSLLLALVMVAGMLPVIAQAETTEPTAYKVGTDKTTKGAWEEGEYGTQAAILYGYAKPITADEITAEESATDTNHRIDREFNNDTLVVKPADSPLSKTSCILNGNNVFCFSPYLSDDAVLDMPDGYEGAKYLMQAVGRMQSSNDNFTETTDGYAAYGSNTRQGYHILEMSDTELHTISLYAYTTYKKDVYITIQDLSGNVLLKDVIAAGTFDSGAYVSYVVPGSVKIIIDQRTDDYSVGISGIFVDPARPAPEKKEASATYLGYDTTTLGNWEGTYGQDTAILYGYAEAMDEAEITKQKNSLNTEKMSITPSSWNASSTLLVQQDAQSSILQSQSFELGGNNVHAYAGYYSGDSTDYTWVSYEDDPAVLNMPAGSTAKKFRVYAAGKLRYTSTQNPGFYGHLEREGFDGLYGIYDTNTETKNGVNVVKTQTLQGRINLTMAEACQFVVSIYGYADFQRQDTQPVVISILDGDDKLLARQAVPTNAFNNGAYMSFLVYSDEINIIEEYADSSNMRGISGVFIDPVVDGSKLNLAAATGETNGSVKLTWSDTGLSANAKVQIERKDGDSWTNVATVAASLKAYEDTGLTPEASYTYRARAAYGANASAYGAEVSAVAKKVEVPVPGMLKEPDTTTLGAWQGKYGLDSAILFSYKFDATKDLKDTENTTGLTGPLNDDGRFTVSKDTMNLMVDTIATPYYSYFYLYFGGNVWSYLAQAEDASVLAMPNAEGAGGTAFNAYAMNGISYKDKDSGNSTVQGLSADLYYAQLTITPTDTNQHIVTLYSNKEQKEAVHVYVVDEQGNVLAEDTIPAGSLTGGGYVSFPFKAVTANKKVYVYYGAATKNSFGFSGVFLDTLQNVASELSAEGYCGDGTKLTWTNAAASAGCQTLIQRSTDGQTWTDVATVSGSSYTDEGLTPGTTYTYRVSTVFGSMASGVYSNTASYTAQEHVEVYVPVYTDGDGIYHISTDAVTRGAWESVYGKDIAFLYGYAYDATAQIGTTDRFAVDHNKNDLVITKEGLDYSFSHSYNSGGNLQSWMPDVNVTADAILNMPAGITRPEFEVVAASSNANNKPEYSFTFTDEGVHLLSLYNEHGGAGSVTITFVDPDTNETLFEQTLREKTFKGGAYVSYLVSGKVKVILTRTSNSTSFSGVFVDALAACPISGLTAEAGTDPRSIKLTWTETDVPAGAQILIERKAEDGQWQQITTSEAEIGTYQDENLLAGTVYTYRLRVKTGEAAYSASSLTAQFEIEAYDKTGLVLDADRYTAEDATQNVTIQAQLADVEANPLSGYTVVLTVDYEHSVQTVSAVTDAYGYATFTFKPDYLGLAAVTVSFHDNDAARLMHSSDTAELYVGQTEWKEAPVVWNISDGVLPGNLVSLNGYGMADVENLKVYYAPHGTAITESSATLAPVNSDAVYGYYVIVQLPVDAQPGLYDFAVANSYGMSDVMTLNIARPLFIDEYEAWNGQTIMLSGRNLEGAQFGFDSTTKVRLVSSSGAVEQTITKLTPYSIRFTVSGTVGTTYNIEVSNNDGITWAPLDSEQTLTIVEEGLDPLNLGVAWADHYNWSAPYLDVTDFGAVAGDKIDDTAAFQRALDAAGAQTGGGVVYVPDGSYLVGNIQLSAYTVLLGESTEGTILKYYNPNENDGGGLMFSNTADSKAVGQIGLANFSVRLYDDAVRPDTFLWLGHNWGTANKDQAARTAKELFVSGVDIAYSYQEATQRGLGMVYLAKERVVIQNSSFVGFNANTQSCYANEYVRYIGNYYSFDEGAIGSVALYNFVLDCTVNDVNRENAQDNHAFMMRQTTHWENNWVEGTGNDTNVGEAFCVEMPGGSFAIGQVVNSTANTITALFPNQELDKLTVMYGRLAVTITSGKGMGQLRDIESYDFSTGTIVLKEEWDVLPDATSRFTITSPLDRVTVYNNGMDDNTKGIFMYGNGYDNVVANNYLEDSEGIFIYSSDVLPGRSTPNYFTTVRDNVLNGPGTENAYVNISMRSNRPSGNGGTFFNTSIYAIEVRNNIIIGDSTAAPSNNCSEANIANGLSSNSAVNNGEVGTDGVFGDNLGIIWENNDLQHLSDGIEVSLADYGFAYMGNVMTDVGVPVVNEPEAGQNVTGLSAAELAAAPAVTKEILSNYIDNYQTQDSISGYSEQTRNLLEKVLDQAITILNDSESQVFDYAFALNRLRIAASMRDIPQGGDEIIAILLGREACIDCKDNDGDGVCDACGHVFAVATIGAERYGTIAAAVKAAQSGETIVLVADEAVDTIALTKGVTLDLNGFTLEAEYVVAIKGNAVTDSMGGGLLKCENVRLDAKNPALPVWVVVNENEAGYRFFTVLDQQMYREQMTDSFVFIAKPALGTAKNDGLMAQSTTNRLSVKMRLSWQTTSGNLVEQMFTMKAEDVKTVYSVGDNIMELTVTGAGPYVGKLYTTTYIESKTGVIWTGTDLLYSGAQNQ